MVKEPARPALERTLQGFELFQQRLTAAHVPEFTALDITMAQAKVLYVAASADGLTMSDVAQRLGVAVSTASGTVDHLVGLRLLAREEDPRNRRQVRVSITPLGAATLEQLRELSNLQLRRFLRHLSDEELEVIDHATHLMADALAAEQAAVEDARPPSVPSSSGGSS